MFSPDVHEFPEETLNFFFPLADYFSKQYSNFTVFLFFKFKTIMWEKCSSRAPFKKKTYIDFTINLAFKCILKLGPEQLPEQIVTYENLSHEGSSYILLIK